MRNFSSYEHFRGLRDFKHILNDHLQQWKLCWKHKISGNVELPAQRNMYSNCVVRSIAHHPQERARICKQRLVYTRQMFLSYGECLNILCTLHKNGTGDKQRFVTVMTFLILQSWTFQQIRVTKKYRTLLLYLTITAALLYLQCFFCV